MKKILLAFLLPTLLSAQDILQQEQNRPLAFPGAEGDVVQAFLDRDIQSELARGGFERLHGAFEGA